MHLTFSHLTELEYSFRKVSRIFLLKERRYVVSLISYFSLFHSLYEVDYVKKQ